MRSIQDVLDSMLTVGAALGLQAQSEQAVARLRERVQAATTLASQSAPAKFKKVCTEVCLPTTTFDNLIKLLL